MANVDVLPELKQLIGAMLFAAKHPLTVAEIRRVLKEVGETHRAVGKDFARASEADIRRAVQDARQDLQQARLGFEVTEVAKGFRLVNDSACGPWLRTLLEKGKPSRLSPPALETLAIIAYRQPCTRAEIEAVRGVEVDQMVRNLLEMQLIRMVGRSELPGRPWLLGTTQTFLEHFGLNSLEDLPGIEELRRIEAEQSRAKAPPIQPDEHHAVSEDDEDDEGEDDE